MAKKPTKTEIAATNEAAAGMLAMAPIVGDMQAALDAALPNVQDMLDRFTGARLSYKLNRAVMQALEFPTIRGYIRRSRDADFAAQRALREAQDSAAASQFDYDEDEIVGETRNEGEIEADQRSDRTLPDFPHESVLGGYLWLRREVNRAASLIPATEQQFYPALRPLPVVALGVAQYQTSAQKERAAAEADARAAAEAEISPAQQKAMLAAALRKLERAESFHAKARTEDSAASVATAKARLARLNGTDPVPSSAPTSDAAHTSDAVKVAVQDFLNAAKAEGAHAMADEDWLMLPIYVQHAIWEAVSDVLALELEVRNRGRLTQLFNEDDAMFLSRMNERDDIQHASQDAAELALAFDGHWQVVEMRNLRAGNR